MNVTNLGRLERVDLRKAWQNETGEFTPWLAQAGNLNLLGETIGIELELESQEKQVGPFRADVLCKDTADDSWVLIENQLERTDHLHLGQLLTYAAGLEAVTVVWVAEKFTEEHRAALDWLNERTDEKLKFFGLEIELWRIGDSSIAPKFNIVCKPNSWGQTVRDSVELTEHRRIQLQFWTAFREYMERAKSPVKCQKPSPQHWMNHSIGRSGTWLASIASYWNSATNTAAPEIRVELNLGGKDAKQKYAELEKRKQEVESQLGVPLTWHNPEGKLSCRIYTREDADFLKQELWPQQHEWLRKHLELFQKVFAPIVKEL